MNLSIVSWDAFRVSAQVSLVSTALCVIVGVPLAWRIARSGPAISNLLSSFSLLPLVLPPTAIGYYLLYGLGRQSALGRFLTDDLGLRLVFTWPGAAIAAAVVSVPLVIRTAQAGFEQIDPDLLAVARTMSSPSRVFWRVAVPLAWPSLAAATVIGFARNLGEFGATVIVASSIPGETRTVPAAIYDATQAGDPVLANTLAALMLLMGVALLALLAWFLHRAQGSRRA